MSIKNQHLSNAAIAKMTGLSPATISKVVNGRPGVSPKTRALVDAVIAQQGLPIRRKAQTSSSSAIELVLSHVNSTSTIDLLRGATVHAQQLGISVTISNVPAGVDRMERFRQILDRNPLGVILELEDVTHQERAFFQSRGIPYVVINLTRGMEDDMLTIGVDNWAGWFLSWATSCGVGAYSHRCYHRPQRC